MAFKRAVREQARARVAIDGPAKAGKSFTALRLAFALGSKVAAIDTEFGSLSKYAGDSPDGEGPLNFDVVELTKFSPAAYIAAIHDAESAKYEVLVIDSLSHAWVGKDGILDQADRSTNKNRFAKWKDLTPQQRSLVDAILASPLHVVCTMRSKMEYELQDVLNAAGTAKVKTPVKIGLAPVQREGMEYEFDLLCSIDVDHMLKVSGSRCAALDGATAMKPGATFFRPYVDWLRVGVAPTPRVVTEDTTATTPTPTAANGKPSTNGTHPPPITPPPAKDPAPYIPRAGAATAEQLASLTQLRDQLFAQAGDSAATPEQRTAIWSDILKRRHVTTARDLSTSEAEQLIGKLSARVNAKEPLNALFPGDRIGDGKGGPAQPDPAAIAGAVA